MARERRTVFISYSHAHANQPWLKRLQVHLTRLEREGSVERWDDTRIEAGAAWRKEIERSLASAVAAVLLVTEDFIASDFINKYELAPLLRSAKRNGTLVIPVIAMPCSYAKHPQLSALQAVNTPSRPLAKMKPHEQEELWTRVVSQIERKLSTPTKSAQHPPRRKKAETKDLPPLVRLESIPVIGRFLGRREEIDRIRAFLADNLQNVVIVQGFYGVGKTALMAKLVGTARGVFEDVCWLTCSADQASADMLLSTLAAFFAKHGDRALRDVWDNADPSRFPIKVDRLIGALRAKRYLIVLDGFEEWLNADLQVANVPVRTVLRAILRGTHQSKVVIISRNRPLFDPTTDAPPLGSSIEETIPGLDRSDAIELLRLSGLKLEDALLARLAEDYEGNPQLLQIASYQIRGLHRDPEELLAHADPDNRVGQLLAYTLKNLSSQSRDVLELLAILRRPLTRAQVIGLGFRFDRDVGPLLNRFLVQADPTSQLLAIGGQLRKSIVASLSEAHRTELHRRAADFCALAARELDATSQSEKVRLALDEAFHRRAFGDFVGAGRVVSGVATLLIDWGYIEQAEANLELVIAHPAEASSRARALADLGRIADLRGQYDAALVRFRGALALFEAGPNYAGVAEVLYRMGRIHNARGALDKAEGLLRRCALVCKKHGTAAGLPGAELALGWNHQQRGKPMRDVMRHFEHAIKHATEADDWTVLCGALRNMGFLLWDGKRDEAGARAAYAQAMKIARTHDLAKETSALETDLALLHTRWGDAKSGEQFARRGIDLTTRLGDKYGLANAYSNLGAALEDQERWPDAANAYSESTRLAGELQNVGGQIFAARGLARIHLRAGELPQARSLLKVALQRAQKRGLKQLSADVAKDLRAI